jgi:hypothetical protein
MVGEGSQVIAVGTNVRIARLESTAGAILKGCLGATGVVEHASNQYFGRELVPSVLVKVVVDGVSHKFRLRESEVEVVDA